MSGVGKTPGQRHEGGEGSGDASSSIVLPCGFLV